MRILYAIQGTGNGHLSRARDIIPLLLTKGEVDILVSGIQADVELPYPVKYKFKGLSFIFGKKGGVDILSTYKKSNLKQLYKEIKSLPVELYDIIINDFEPVSAWACFIRKKECISLSHQAAVTNKKAPSPKDTDIIGKTILKKYAPATHKYGFHFKAYDNNIFTPVIRSQIREIYPFNQEHYTVYLPAYDDENIIKVLREAKHVNWRIFSKHTKKAYTKKNFMVMPISNDAFIDSMATCTGMLCGAGFETPAEALFLKKKLMVIPMKKQYEQHCNAAALEQMGVDVIKSLKKKYIPRIDEWINGSKIIPVNYPDITCDIINMIIKKHSVSIAVPKMGQKISSLKDFKEYSVKNIIHNTGE
ncbi:MAG: glycosyltransferase family protein [Ginsengibacter sp.]